MRSNLRKQNSERERESIELNAGLMMRLRGSLSSRHGNGAISAYPYWDK